MNENNNASTNDDVRSVRVQQKQMTFVVRVEAPHSELVALLRYFYTDSLDMAFCNSEALQVIVFFWFYLFIFKKIHLLKKN